MKSALLFLGILLFCGSVNAQAAVGPATIRIYKTFGAGKLARRFAARRSRRI